VLRADLPHSIKRHQGNTLTDLANYGMTQLFVVPYVLLEMEDHGHEWTKGELIDVAVFYDAVLDMAARMDDA